MDLLFSKYANPYFLLDEMLSANQLSDFVYSVALIENERKLWELYLACVANPRSEVTSFNEFKRKNTIPTVDKSVDLEATIKNSFDVLQGFNPEE